jgi:hypothetical protein
MRIEFVPREGAPERLVTEAEMVFEEGDGPLAGLKIVGLSLWRSPDGEIYVTFPSRAFGLGAERRFFDYLRGVDGDMAAVKRLKSWVVEQYAAKVVTA